MAAREQPSPQDREALFKILAGEPLRSPQVS